MNPASTGTKAAVRYHRNLTPGETLTSLRLRLPRGRRPFHSPFADFDAR